MTALTAENTPLRRAVTGRRAEIAVAISIMVLVLCIAAPQNFPTLADAGGDNDSLLRLVMVRDLLAGQGWFDPTMRRMGLEGGFAMHWSRLVDAPIAFLVAAFGEQTARVAWPVLLLGLSALALVRGARIAFGVDALLPASALGAAGLITIGIFDPGALDHHNVQVTLTLWMVIGLLHGSRAGGVGAAIAASTMMVIAAESLPLVAAGGLVAAMLHAFTGAAGSRRAAGFGLGFAVAALIAYLATVAPGGRFVAACDAYSIAQAAVAVPAGLGLALLATITPAAHGPLRRILGLCVIGAGLAAIVLLAFPQCLGDPYATLDPRLKALWLDGVTEAQSVVSVLRTDPAMAATWYFTPLVALTVVAWRVWRGSATQADLIIGTLLGTAFTVSLWQVRGAVFAVPLAVLPLTGWIMECRKRAESGRPAAVLAMALAWALSINGLAAAAVRSILPAPTLPLGSQGVGGVATEPCYADRDYVALAALPPGTVLSVSNLGSAILAHTPHRALSGPYHRNVAGNLAALDMLMASPAAAEAQARAAGVTIVAACPGNSEWRNLSAAAPEGLAAQLAGGFAPAWLVPVAQPDPAAALKIYRVDDK